MVDNNKMDVNRAKIIINNLLSEICNKVWEDNEATTYLNWLKTEIGMTKDEIEELIQEDHFPIPYGQIDYTRD